MSYWLAKTEPNTYSWSDLVRDKQTSWTGVRNFQARNNLRAMKKGDQIFIYHSGDEKSIQGIAEVISDVYPDKTAKEGDWITRDFKAVKPLARSISLKEIKSIPECANMVLLHNSRLSVQPVSANEWGKLISIAQ